VRGRALLFFFSLCVGCETGAGEVPEGALAIVGQVPIGPEDVADAKGQLDAHGQARFRGPAGDRALLDALVVEELLVQEATRQGLEGDPRVDFAVREEMAELHVRAELERRLPRAEVENDDAALSRYVAEHDDAFRIPERRTLRAVEFSDFAAAEAALARLLAGEAKLEDLGPVLESLPRSRNDAEHPAFDRHLFDPALSAGDIIPEVLLTDRRLMVGVVGKIEPSRLPDLEDPIVRERAVTGLYEQLAAPLRREIMKELAEGETP
jgi:hypothetical protein